MIMRAFMYHPDPLGTGAFQRGDPKICSCCRSKTDIWYSGPFYPTSDCYGESEFDVKWLCPECIDRGTAAWKCLIQFVDPNYKIPNEINYEELVYCTPGIVGVRNADWEFHCNDYCEYHGIVSWDDLIRMSVVDELEIDSMNCIDGYEIPWLVENLKKDGDAQGVLFRCLSCRKYILKVVGKEIEY